ncbi:FAD linked oxidase [Macrophomina phaseolina MS6]|uniref:FAD linked oxidase n=1 Tax=Macrophomina phaseolina (strain MS6) TaxID=1126212 RepID=K2RD31_MACPH|nr:FAD linked oxidase [Macrophomina phaseolina MS6]
MKKHSLGLAAIAVYLAADAHAQPVSATPDCKITPLDSAWPSEEDWSSLNASIDGLLIRSAPVASSCWPGNPLNSPKTCEQVQAGWNSSDFHATLPESVDAPYYANSSCLPPGIPGYFPERGCTVGGYPQFIVNATTEQHIATAVKWASDRNIRIVVKGTGHDLAGRSSGAFALSIWTHNFRRLDFEAAWKTASGNVTDHVVIVGSGLRWRDVYEAAEVAGRAVVGGGDGSVGMGGHIQAGGHGPLSSTYGLAADQINEVTVVTTDGRIITANEGQYQDLLWAIRGGTGGLYGIVTEYVLKTYPAVSNVTLGAFSISAANNDSASIDAVLDAAAILTSKIPSLMDAGLAGTVYLSTGLTSLAFNPTAAAPPPGIAISYQPFAYNTTSSALTSLIAPILQTIASLPSAPTIQQSVPTVYPSFTTWFHAFGQSTPVGTGAVLSSHLLSRAALANTTRAALRAHITRALAPQDATIGSSLILTMTAGRGPASVPAQMRGALLPVWRRAYVHAITTGAVVDIASPEKTPEEALKEAADWVQRTLEPAWEEWSPHMGAYFNEANPFLEDWRGGFYGESYKRLREVKGRYDPSGSLWVLGGVGNEEWEYDWGSGRLCRVEGRGGDGY